MSIAHMLLRTVSSDQWLSFFLAHVPEMEILQLQGLRGWSDKIVA